MLQLIFVSFLWAFSFGLIKSQLTGLDSNLVAALRLWISFLIFLPFLKLDVLKKIVATTPEHFALLELFNLG